MPRINDETPKTKGFGQFNKSGQPRTEQPQQQAINTQDAEQSKAIAQQTAQGLEQYLGHTGLDVLNQVRGAKAQITDAVSSAIAAELVPGRIQAEVLTATVGKLQRLDPSTTKGFEWGCLPQLPSVEQLPVVDISHLFPASATMSNHQALPQFQPSNLDEDKGN